MIPEEKLLEGEANDVNYDRAFGSLMGSLVGNAMGAHLQYKQMSEITKGDVEKAMRLDMNAYMSLRPGQITDEMGATIYLMKAIAEGKGRLNLDLIQRELGEWY